MTTESPQPVRFASLVVIAVILATAAVTYLGPILAPALVAAFLYFMIRPVAEALVRIGMAWWIAYLVLFIVTILVISAVARVVSVNFEEFRKYLPIYRENVLAMSAWLPGDQLDESVKQMLGDAFDMSVQDVLSLAFGPAVTFLETLLLVIFYLLFIIISADRLPRRIARALDPHSASQVLIIGLGISEGITHYLKVKTLISLGMGASAGIILWCFGVHYWPLWAFLTFVLNYITYVGSMVACVPPVVLALVQFPNPSFAAGLGALVVANRIVWIDFVEIKYSGKSLNVDPVLLLLSIAYWGWFWGILGLILAVPMTVCLKIALSNLEKGKPWAILLSEE